ncbi:MAG: choice-of-anchor tandem repeat GloVer-containing protein [Candidatus Sulfotelmatobacter sp.]
MKSTVSFQSKFFIAAAIVLALGSAAFAGTEKTLHSFNAATGNGPTNGVIFDAAGNLYGTTSQGDSKTCNNNEFGCGVVFEMSPKANGTWSYNVIYEFTGGVDGLHPSTQLVFDAAGNLYGATYGPINTHASYGTIYELSPNGDGTWKFSLLYTFPGGNGGGQPNWLVIDGSGNLYGTAQEGGSFGQGIVFELSPSSGAWKFSLVHTFTGCQDGGLPLSLAFDAKGNLYGTSELGGLKCSPSSGGTIFELIPNSGGGWHESVLDSFDDGPSGGATRSLIFDTAGNMYGVGFEGGKNGQGVVFKLTPGSNGKWSETVLHNFNGQNGFRAQSLIFGSGGELYGSTMNGPVDSGLVFEMANQAGAPETIVWQFTGGTDGNQPQGPIILDQAGNIYGTTSAGGASGAGAVFEITP